MRSARSDADQEQSSAVLVISEKLPSYTCATFWRCRILENEWNPNISSTEPRKDNFPWRWNGLLRLKEELSHVVTGWKRLLQCTRFFTRQINGLPLAAFINPKLQWSTCSQYEFLSFKVKKSQPLWPYSLLLCSTKKHRQVINNSEHMTVVIIHCRLPALEGTSCLFIVVCETKHFGTTFLKTRTTEMIPESTVLPRYSVIIGSHRLERRHH